MVEKERRITLRLPESLYFDVEKYTKDTGMSITEFMRRACRYYLAHTDESKKVISPECIGVSNNNRIDIELHGDKISIICNNVQTLINAAAAIANYRTPSGDIKQQGIGNKMEISK